MAQMESTAPLGTNGAGHATAAPAPFQLSEEAFRRSFAEMRPLIRKEWPQVDDASLDATGGDLGGVVELISKKTDQTPEKVRKQLAELSEIAENAGNNIEKRLNVIIENLEAKSKQLMGNIRNDVLPQAEATVRENLWASILVAMGLGLVLGLVVGLSGRR